MANTFDTSRKMYSVKKNSTGYTKEIEPRIFIVSKWIGKNKKILDVGCYNGWYSSFFKNNNNKVYGIDASKDGVKEAIRKGIYAKVTNVEEKFPYPDQFFDVIHAGEIIEHLYDTDKFIEECYRVLKKGGTLIITTPNTVSLPRRILYLFGSGKFFEASNTFSTEKIAVGHIRFFTKQLLKNFVESKGFKLKEFTSDFVNFPLGIKSKTLAKIKPTFGRSLITKFIKK
jgi:2-polyprenyl-3-methyl-5-hydroxy-6-metoxy-1,4-benzoquinol methylase